MTSFCSPKCTSTARLDGKTAIITGCNSGIGKHTAFDFCKRGESIIWDFCAFRFLIVKFLGCRVIMACRNTEKAEEAKNDILKQIMNEVEKEEKIGVLEIRELDLSSLTSVRKCAQEILDQEPRIDLLINNAGIMMCPQGETEDGYEKQFATNHLGHFLFTLLLLPRILSSAPARIVNVSSSGHSLCK